MEQTAQTATVHTNIKLNNVLKPALSSVSTLSHLHDVAVFEADGDESDFPVLLKLLVVRVGIRQPGCPGRVVDAHCPNSAHGGHHNNNNIFEESAKNKKHPKRGTRHTETIITRLHGASDTRPRTFAAQITLNR